MAAPQLTERQAEIKKLLDEGKTPREVGEALGVTENAIYQHIRRMRSGGTRVRSVGNGAGRKPAAKKPAAKKATRAAAKPAPARPAPVASEPRPMTPLQAIRERMSTIRTELKIADDATRDALDAAEKAKATAAKVFAKHDAEMSQLLAAEAALTGKPVPKPAAKRAPRKPAAVNNGPAAVAPSPAPEPTPPEPVVEAPAAPNGDAVAAEFDFVNGTLEEPAPAASA